MPTPHKDDVTGIETTGHEWDGIRELNNPLPRWWLWCFYCCIIFAIGYAIYYPAIPLATTNTKGISGWSSRANLAQSLSEHHAKQAVFLDKIANSSLEDIRKDPDLFNFALAGGKSTFAVNCSQCHGAGAQGAAGYPNLNDDDWLWGGNLKTIRTTIRHGIRYDADDDTRVSDMPAFGADELLTPSEIDAVADHVLSLSGARPDNAKGAAIFADNCAVCHGKTGHGNHSVGAPNLTDAIWLFSGKKKQIVAQITKPHHSVMPAWSQRLSDVKIKQLTLYVHSLGGGQ